MSLVRPNVKKTDNETVEEEVIMTQEVEQEVVEDVAVEQKVETSQEVAVQQTKAVAPSSSVASGLAAHLTQMEEEGFADLEVNAMSFDRVKLHEGSFKAGDNDFDLGKNIKFKPLAIKAVYLFSQSDDDDAETFYSYCPNGSTLTDGTSSEETLAEWKADGFEPVSRAYQEVLAELVDRDDDWDGEIVSLSIPPASRSRFGGVTAISSKRNNCSIGDLIISATPSEMLKSRGGASYRRWVFKLDRVDL